MSVSNLKNKAYLLLWGWLVVLSCLFFIFLIINLLPSKSVTQNNSDIETKFNKLSEFNEFDSSFIALNNNLNRIDVLFKNPNLESRDELKIVILEGNNIIYEQFFTGFNFGDTSRARLDFESISNSAGRKYDIKIVTTKTVDGKLYFGVKGGELDLIQYFELKPSLKSAVYRSLILLKNWLFLLPLVTITLFLW